jgi:hypothetical protein
VTARARGQALVPVGPGCSLHCATSGATQRRQVSGIDPGRTAHALPTSPNILQPLWARDNLAKGARWMGEAFTGPWNGPLPCGQLRAAMFPQL